jgi:hypothetical protein
VVFFSFPDYFNLNKFDYNKNLADVSTPASGGKEKQSTTRNDSDKKRGDGGPSR